MTHDSTTPDAPRAPTELDKQALVDRLGAARNELLRVLRAAPPERRLSAVFEEGWSVADLVGHIASWEDRLLTLAQMLINREEHKIEWLSGQAAVDGWNHKEYLRKREWTWEETLRNLALIREELLWNLGWATPQELFQQHEASGATASAADLMEEVIDHDQVHAAQIGAWLGSSGSHEPA